MVRFQTPMEIAGEILVVPFFGQGHFLPSMELCRRLCSMQHKTTLIISAEQVPAIPTSLLHHDLFNVSECTASPPDFGNRSKAVSSEGPHQLFLYFQELGRCIESFLESMPASPDRRRPVFAVVGSLMCWSMVIFKKFNVPVVTFFTCAAVDVALEYAAWKADVENLKPGETRLIPGLPEEMSFSYSDLTIRRRSDHHTVKSMKETEVQLLAGPAPVHSIRKRKSFPTKPGDEPPWVEDTKGAVAFLVNTCDGLERPFIDYISSQLGIPVWGIGPLMPEIYWNICHTNITFSESKIRPNRKSNYSEEQVIQWLDSKPHRSVIYVSFGSQTLPEWDELEEIAKALEELDRPFIWGLQTGGDVVREYYPHGLDSRVGDRGLIIQGWSPQLLILSHPSVGGCLTHSGWNSAMEAIGLGIPTLAWPIRGDQFYNAKSIESHLKVGYLISTRSDNSAIITKDVIIQGIERLMTDEEVHKRVQELRDKVFKHGFPASSVAAWDAFKDFISSSAS